MQRRLPRTGSRARQGFGALAATSFALGGLAIAPATPAAGGTAFSWSAEGGTDRVDDRVERSLQTSPDSAEVPVIVTFTGDAAADRGKAELDDGDLAHEYRSVPAVAASLTKDEIEALATDPGVAAVEADVPVKASMSGARASTGVDAAVTQFGVNGDAAGDGAKTYGPADVVVAVVDTGIDRTHVDLNGGKIIAFRDMLAPEDVGDDCPTAPAQGTAYDDNGHGTHVAGIVAGEGDGDAARRGVAPGAALVGVKVLDCDGSGMMSNVAAGLDWVLTNRATYGIEAVNLSLGSLTNGTGQGPFDMSSVLVNKLTAAGVSVFVAAGNRGPGSGTVSQPAVAKYSLAVGAMTEPYWGGWALADFSSRGPTTDGRLKPDLAAPGDWILAPDAGSGSGYVYMSGTSMATPFAAGVGALLLQADPSLAPSGTTCTGAVPTTGDCADGVQDASMTYPLRDLLASTAHDWGAPGQDNAYGHGLIDAYAAVAAALGDAGESPQHIPGRSQRSGTLVAGESTTWTVYADGGDDAVSVTLLGSSFGAGATGLTVEVAPPGEAPAGSGSLTPAVPQANVVVWPDAGAYEVTVRATGGSAAFQADVSGATSVVLTPTNLVIQETDDSTAVDEATATSDSWTVALAAEPSADVAVGLLTEDARLTLSADTLTFTAADWSVPQTVTVTAADDLVDESDVPSAVLHEVVSDDESFASDPYAHQVAVDDDDTAGVLVARTGTSTAVSEAGTSDTYTVRLRSQPTSDVTIRTVASVAGQVSRRLSTVRFTPANWSTPQVVTVSAVNDRIAESLRTVSIAHGVDAVDLAYDNRPAPSLGVSVVDNDRAGFVVAHTSGSTKVMEGWWADSYTVRLTSRPTKSVTVSVLPNGQVRPSRTSLTFTAANWDRPQRVTLWARDDSVREGAHSTVQTHRASSWDPKYHRRTVPGKRVYIRDND